MNWLFFALLAPLLWAGSNFVDKFVLERHVKGIFDFLFFSALFSWVFFFILVLIFGFPVLTWYSVLPVAMGMLLTGTYGFYGKALEQGETSTLVILFKLIPVLTVALGFLILGQTLTGTEFLAFLLVLFGATAVSVEKIDGRILFIKGAKWMFISIFLWSIMFLISDFALDKMPFWDFFILDTLGMALAGLVLFLHPVPRKQVMEGLRTASSAKYGWFLLNDLFDFFGQMSMKKALSLAPSAGLVTVAIQAQSLYAIILGVILTLLVPRFIKEDISLKHLSKKIIGAVIIFIGIVLLF